MTITILVILGIASASFLLGDAFGTNRANEHWEPQYDQLQLSSLRLLRDYTAFMFESGEPLPRGIYEDDRRVAAAIARLEAKKHGQSQKATKVN